MSDKTVSLKVAWSPIDDSSGIIAKNAKATQFADYFNGKIYQYTAFFSSKTKECFIVLKRVKFPDDTIIDIDPSDWLVYKFEGKPHNVSDEEAVIGCITIVNYVGKYIA